VTNKQILEHVEDVRETFRAKLKNIIAILLILGGKKVYWSSSKVASHIRSGHCSGASDEEVQMFKKEFVYDSPKNLVHKSAITKKFKEHFEIEEQFAVSKRESPKRYTRKVVQLDESPEPKRTKIEMIEEYENDEIIYEDYNSPNDNSTEEKLEIVFLPNSQEDQEAKHTEPKPSSSGLSREEKFINEVYPQFKGKTKLDLIDQVLELKRRIEMLQTKAKTYENTINRLLN
jgi:hypothetical protein